MSVIKLKRLPFFMIVIMLLLKNIATKREIPMTQNNNGQIIINHVIVSKATSPRTMCIIPVMVLLLASCQKTVRVKVLMMYQRPYYPSIKKAPPRARVYAMNAREKLLFFDKCVEKIADEYRLCPRTSLDMTENILLLSFCYA